ncbi:hypothetical protein CNR30_00335, partial [Levilactobacillus brevis]
LVFRQSLIKTYYLNNSASKILLTGSILISFQNTPYKTVHFLSVQKEPIHHCLNWFLFNSPAFGLSQNKLVHIQDNEKPPSVILLK